MLSGLASYIWGGAEEAAPEQQGAGANSGGLTVSSAEGSDALLVDAEGQEAPSSRLTMQVTRQQKPKPKSTNKPRKGSPPQPQQQQQPSPQKPQEDDWVLVEPKAKSSGAGLNLGSLNDVVPRPVTGSTGSSETQSESGENSEEMEVDEEEMEEEVEEEPSAGGQQQLSRTARRLAAPFSADVGSSARLKAVKAGQSAKKSSAKTANSAKGLKKKNMAVKHSPSANMSKKDSVARNNFCLKASGGNKHLKQC